MALQVVSMAFALLKVPIFMVFSVFAQFLVTIQASFQKRIASKPLTRAFWLLTYSLADFTAVISLTYLFRIQIQPETGHGNSQNKYLLACWAPFILKHLGRHGEATVLSLKDNTFWLSHFLTSLLNWIVAILISIQALGHNPLGFTLPFVILAGTWKLVERVFALKYSSIEELRISTLKNPNHENNYVHKKAEKLRECYRRGEPSSGISNDIESLTSISIDGGSTSSPGNLMCEAYRNFDRYKCIFADSIPFEQPNDQQNSFLNGDHNDENCLRIVEMEVKFAYDFFYTKSVVSQRTWVWFFRGTSMISVFSAFVFYILYDKEEFSQTLVVITYILIIATLGFEMSNVVGSAMSDFCLVQLQLQTGWFWRMGKMVIRCDLNNSPRPIRNVGQYNLLNFCFSERRSRKWKGIIKFFHLDEIWKNYFYSEFVMLDETLLRNMLPVLRTKLKRNELVKYPNASLHTTPLGLADWISMDRKVTQLRNSRYVSEETKRILRRSIDRGFKDCVLIWHIASDICFQSSTILRTNYLDYANILSNYMLYLMVVEETTMSSISVVERRTYHNACAAGIADFSTISNPDFEKNKVYMTLWNDYKTVLSSSYGRKDSLLADGYELGSELERLSKAVEGGEDEVWEMVFGVWIELLSFGAISCSGKQHAELIGTGWQLVTFIWFFMAHCGMPSVNHAAVQNSVHPTQRESIARQP